MINLRLSAVSALSFLILSGCALAPGQHFGSSSFLGTPTADNGDIEVIPITPKLLAVQKSTAVPAVSTALPEELLKYQPAPYRVGIGDVLQVIVWDHPELSAPAGQQQQTEANGRQVRHDGTMFFPFVGALPVAGKTINEIRDALSRKLAAWVEMPQVDVNVIRVNSAKVTLSGAFERPQEQAITQAPLTLLAAIGNAGIKTQDADLTALTLKRDGRDYPIDLDALSRGQTNQFDKVFLKAGDHLHLAYNDRRKAYVLGEVTRPGSLVFKTSTLPLSDVIGQAGGIRQDTANADAVYVIRGAVGDGPAPIKVYQLSARTPVSMALASHFEVQPQDVVFVGPAGIVLWNRFLSQLLPTVQTFYYGTISAREVRDIQ